MRSIIPIFRENPRLGFVAMLAFLIAIVTAIIMHEFSHGLVAYWNGDGTAKMMGRLNVNPVKHFDPIGFLMMIFVGFGWAKPVPINPTNFKDYKKGMITTSIAGVLCNLIIAFISFGLLALFSFLLRGVTFPSQNFAYYMSMFVVYLLQFGVMFNLSLMAFNILPIYPLDGFRVVETLAKPGNRYVEFMYRYGNFALLGLLLVSTVLGYISPYLDIFSLYLNAIYNGITKLFSMLFGGII